MNRVKRSGVLPCCLMLLGTIGSAQSSGLITTFAGNGTEGYAGDGGPAVSAQLSHYTKIAFDSSGNLYIADQINQRIRKVTRDGQITTVAGNGTPGFSGDGGPAVSAQLNGPTDVAFDSSGNFYIADCGNSRVRKVTPGGVISTVAEIPGAGPIGLDKAGNLYVVDYEYDGWLENSRAIKVTPAGERSTVLGGGQEPIHDGANAIFVNAWTDDIAVDPEGNIYAATRSFSKEGNEVGWLVKVTPDGIIHTIAGGGTQEALDGTPALTAKLKLNALALGRLGSIYINDWSASRILRVTPEGLIATVAGNGTAGYSGDGGPANLAQLNNPGALAIDPEGNLYVSDWDNFRIRKMELSRPTAYFPQFVAGGGWSSLFTFVNTGSTEESGNLIITDPQGHPLMIGVELTDASGTTHLAQTSSSFAFAVPPGGSVILSATSSMQSISSGKALKTGWAQFTSTGGSLGGTVIYEYVNGSSTECIVSVPESEPMQTATIPIYMDRGSGRLLAYAIANPGGQAISVNLILKAQDGTVVDDSVVFNLGAGEQITRYLLQDTALNIFKGTLVLYAQKGQSFVAFAVLDKQGLFAAIPLVPTRQGLSP
jgi:sugar lactone lactonase YvrE